MRCAYSAASRGITRRTDPAAAVMESDLRMSRREKVISGSQIPLLRFVQQIIAGAPGKRHDRERRVLVRVSDEACAIGDEQILYVMRLAESVQGGGLRTLAHPCGSNLMDDDAAIGDAVGMRGILQR